jgi:uncharacterized protein YjbJ (UPF0337 family)
MPNRQAIAACRSPWRIIMNSDIIKGKWKQLSGDIKARWGKLTNDDVDVAEGHSEYLAGKLQERYGWTKEKAEEELRDFRSKY